MNDDTALALTRRSESEEVLKAGKYFSHGAENDLADRLCKIKDCPGTVDKTHLRAATTFVRALCASGHAAALSLEPHLMRWGEEQYIGSLYRARTAESNGPCRVLLTRLLRTSEEILTLEQRVRAHWGDGQEVTDDEVTTLSLLKVERERAKSAWDWFTRTTTKPNFHGGPTGFYKENAASVSYVLDDADAEAVAYVQTALEDFVEDNTSDDGAAGGHGEEATKEMGEVVGCLRHLEELVDRSAQSDARKERMARLLNQQADVEPITEDGLTSCVNSLLAKRTIEQDAKDAASAWIKDNAQRLISSWKAFNKQLMEGQNVEDDRQSVETIMAALRDARLGATATFAGSSGIEERLSSAREIVTVSQCLKALRPVEESLNLGA